MNQLARKQQTWPELVNEVMPQFNAIAEHEKLVIWKAESQFALQAITKSTQLQQCNPNTVQNAIINVAAVGLTLNPADAYAYLVPRKGECTLVISFKGLIKVATDAGGISWVKAEIVKENDTFTYRGISEPPEHIVHTPFNQTERGKTIGTFCVAKTKDGDYLVDLIDIDEINKIKACASTQVVWNQWPEEMAKKSVIKRASKQWPRTAESSRLHKAVDVINETEGSDPLYPQYSDEQKAHFDHIIEKEDAYEYVLFTQSLPTETINGLFNSFEKGNKTKGKEKCRELSKKGFEILGDLKIRADEYCLGNDAHGLAEVIADLEEKGKSLWWHSTTEEIRQTATELMTSVEDDA